MNTGMRTLNGAPRPHLYTSETRLSGAIQVAQLTYPHDAYRFRSHVARYGCISYDATETYWILWRHEYCAAEVHR